MTGAASEQASALVQRWVRSIPDWPAPPVTFRDLTPLFANGAAFNEFVGHLVAGAERFGPVDLVVGIEARGFILGAPVADRMGVGFVPIRKTGKLPSETRSASYALEYGEATIEIHVDALQPGQRVLIVDDVLATGGTLAAAAELVTASGATAVGAVLAIELPALGGRAHLGDLPILALTEY